MTIVLRVGVSLSQDSVLENPNKCWHIRQN